MVSNRRFAPVRCLAVRGVGTGCGGPPQPRQLRTSARRTSRPVGRVLCAGAPCGIAPGGDHPSRPAVAGRLQRSTRRLGRAALERLRRPATCAADPLDLAPGGVYRAARVTPSAGGLLHRRFTLTAPAEAGAAVCSLWHCPAGHPGLPLATTLPCGARTFLGRGLPRTRPPGRLVRRAVDDTRQGSGSRPDLGVAAGYPGHSLPPCG